METAAGESVKNTEDIVSEERKYFLDFLRLIAAGAVVMLHTVSGAADILNPEAYSGETTALLLILDLVTWCVPVFIMISGFLFLDPKKKNDFKTMLIKYCGRILLALFLFGVPFALLEQISLQGRFVPGMLPESFLTVVRGQSWSHMWYLYVIFLLYLFTPLLKKLLARLPLRSVYLIMAGLLVWCGIIPFFQKISGVNIFPVIAQEGTYVFYYVSGYFFACHKKRHPGSNTASRLFLGGCALTAAGMITSRIWSFPVQMAYNYPPTLLFSLLLFGAAREKEAFFRQKWGSGLKKLSSLTFTIYLIHPIFLNLFYKFLHLSPLDYPLYLSLPVFWGVTMILSVFGAWILRKIPPLKKYVL